MTFVKWWYLLILEPLNADDINRHGFDISIIFGPSFKLLQLEDSAYLTALTDTILRFGQPFSNIIKSLTCTLPPLLCPRLITFAHTHNGTDHNPSCPASFR